MKNILIIKCGDTFPEIKEKYNDFEDWIINQSNLPQNVFKVFNVAEGHQLRHPSEYIAAIITGSHTNVNQRLPWITQLKNWITTARYSNIPVLGICFGHQIIAEALGGSAKQNSVGMIAGIENIKITKEGKLSPIFKNTGTSFESYALHGFSVTKLPLGAELLAKNTDGGIEAFKMDKMFGVQFHPEFTEELMKNYLQALKLEGNQNGKVKLKSSFKNQSIISNFLDLALKF